MILDCWKTPAVLMPVSYAQRPCAGVVLDLCAFVRVRRVCVCLHVYALCMRVCMYVFAVCLDACMYAFVVLFTCVLPVCAYVCMYVCMYGCMYVWMYVMRVHVYMTQLQYVMRVHVCTCI